MIEVRTVHLLTHIFSINIITVISPWTKCWQYHVRIYDIFRILFKIFLIHLLINFFDIMPSVLLYTRVNKIECNEDYTYTKCIKYENFISNRESKSSWSSSLV